MDRAYRDIVGHCGDDEVGLQCVAFHSLLLRRAQAPEASGGDPPEVAAAPLGRLGGASEKKNAQERLNNTETHHGMATRR